MNGSLPLEIKLSLSAVNAMIKTKYCFKMKNWLYLMNFICTCLKVGRYFTRPSLIRVSGD